MDNDWHYYRITFKTAPFWTDKMPALNLIKGGIVRAVYNGRSRDGRTFRIAVKGAHEVLPLSTPIHLELPASTWVAELVPCEFGDPAF